tara:strand:- start:632 stop:1324 length:693 start_codon:yes stop_codon:yes gene_type:complete
MAIKKPVSQGSRYKQKIDPVMFFIAYEGAKDEAEYFNALAEIFSTRVPKRLHNLFQFIPVDKTTTNGANSWVYLDLVQSLKSHGISQINRAHHVTFIVIDCDHYFTGTHLTSSMQTLQLCKQKNINVICSNPSFEVWRLCHYLDLSTCSDDFLNKALINKKFFLKKEVSKKLGGESYLDQIKRTKIALQNEDKLKQRLNCIKTPPTKLQSNIGLIFKQIELKGMPITDYL